MPATAAIALLMTMGGGHGRMLLLDKPIIVGRGPSALDKMAALNPSVAASSSAAKVKSGQASPAPTNINNADPLHQKTMVRLGDKARQRRGEAGLDAVFAQRSDGLARLAAVSIPLGPDPV